MPSRDTFRGIATHVLALAVGWVAVRMLHPITPSTAPLPEQARHSGTGRSPRGTTANDLLGAYRDPQVSHEMIARRNQRPPSEIPTGTPAERAAAAKDIQADLDGQLKKVQANESYDYPYAKALIARWVKEDPASCSAWLGTMKSRVGWGDPFDAFARALPAQQALDLMENGWLDTNRHMALPQIAEAIGERGPAELPGILSRLRKDEAASFMATALSHAKVADAAAWLEIAGGDKKWLADLANRWIVTSERPGSSAVNSQKDAELAMAAAAGTPAESFFQQRYEVAVLAGKVNETLARIASEPVTAAAALEAIYRDQGLGPEDAQRKMTEVVSQRYRTGLTEWNRPEWESSLQQVVLGSMPMRDALEQRLAKIDSELPGMFQRTSRASALSEAMVVEPAAVLGLAMDRGMQDEAVDAASGAAGSHDTPLAVQGEIYQALATHDLWTDGHNLRDPKEFAARYFREDPEAAQNWRRSLPATMATSLEEVMR